MHYNALCSVELPKNFQDAADSIPIDDLLPFVIQRKMLSFAMVDQLDKLTFPIIVPISPQTRIEYLVHALTRDAMDPYSASPSNLDNLEFEDQTDEGRQQYETGHADCVRMPDGRVLLCCDSAFDMQYVMWYGKVYKKQSGPLRHRKRTKNARKIQPLPGYPLKKLYSTFDQFMVEYFGCTLNKETDRYGDYYNPNIEWDWFQIGGRWPLQFLVPEDCSPVIFGEQILPLDETPYRVAPKGYRWVAGARKCDIAWDMMIRYFREINANEFAQYEEWCRANQIPKDMADRFTLHEGGLIDRGILSYRSGMSLEEYQARIGVPNGCKYPINTYVLLDQGGWKSGPEITSELDTDMAELAQWQKQIEAFVDSQPDEAMLVSVDYHL